MSAFHKSSAFVPRSVGLGLACGAFVGVALLATGTTVTTTMKPRLMVNVNRRRPLACLLSDWLNISSSSKALDNVRHPYNLLSKLFHRPTKTLAVQVVADVPPLSYPPQDALLFRGTNFPTPELLSIDTLSRNIDDLSPMSSSDLTVDTTQLDGQSGYLLGDDDQLDSALSHGEDVPAIVEGFNATLTIIDGDMVQLLEDLSALVTKAAHEQLPLTLLVEFKGDTSSASRIIQGTFSNLNKYVQCLAVYMPQFSHVEISQQLVNPTQSSTLQHLVWRGNNISELSLQRGSVSGFPLQSLRTLSLTCELALDDCIQILFQCESLTSFSVRSLVEADSFMKHDFHNKKVPHLKSLTVKSDVLLVKLFETLHMAQLDSIDLELGPDACPRDGVCTLAVRWGKLRNVRLVGIRDTNCADVKQQCASAKLLHLQTL